MTAIQSGPEVQHSKIWNNFDNNDLTHINLPVVIKQKQPQIPYRLKSKRISLDKINNCLFLTERYCIYIICISDFIPFSFFCPISYFMMQSGMI